MKLFVTILLLALSLNFSAQEKDSLATKHMFHKESGTITMGMGLVGYSGAAMLYPSHLQSNKRQAVMFAWWSAGVTFTVISINHFVKARKLKKQLKKQ